MSDNRAKGIAVTKIECRGKTGRPGDKWVLVSRVDDERARALVDHRNGQDGVMDFRIREERTCISCHEPLDGIEGALGSGRCAACEKTSGGRRPA